MKNTYDQPFDESAKSTAYFLAETHSGSFLQFLFVDELGATYARTLGMELDETQSIVTQLAKYIHDNGLELTEFREITRKTTVAYSLTDDTPGTTHTDICFHINVDTTSQIPRLDDNSYKAMYVSLDEMLDNFQNSIEADQVTELGVAALINERYAIGSK